MDGSISPAAAESVTHEAEHQLGHALPNVDDMIVRTTAPTDASGAPHTQS